jgi:uncharacterized protein (DUF1778 family)
MPSIGRPKLEPSQRRAAITQVRLSDDERARVAAAAKKRGLRLSDWMREILLENAPPVE